MSSENAPESDGFDSLIEALAAISGEGWFRVDLVRGQESTGFELLGEAWTAPIFDQIDSAWTKKGSWSTGAGNGFILLRAEIAGETVDLIQERSTYNERGESKERSKGFLAVHDESGRGVSVDDRHGSTRLRV